MKKQIAALVLVTLLVGNSDQANAQAAKSKAYSAAGKKVQVYTTAENTNQKLSAASDLVELIILYYLFYRAFPFLARPPIKVDAIKKIKGAGT